jgi:hypothetical protein
VGGLSSDSVVMHDTARKIYPEVNLVDFESATREALTRLHPLKIERVWESAADFGSPSFKKTSKIFSAALKHEGFFIDHREMQVDAALEEVFDVVTKIRIKQFVVDVADPNRLLLLHSQRNEPGEKWMEWRVEKRAQGTRLMQTVYFTPHGLGGFLYWFLLHPFHVFAFRRLMKNIVFHSVVK